MPVIAYKNTNLRKATLDVVYQASKIIDEYAMKGFDLTLRQLYYQFVARGLISNTVREYKKLGGVIDSARLCGLIDWDHLVDRTRSLRSLAQWNSPHQIVRACADQFRTDLWRNQKYRPEVWIEKDALVGVIENVCESNMIPFMSCRGYMSQSEMWSASQRLWRHLENKQQVVVFHLGDHDPSGVDMSRDIEERLKMFLSWHWCTDQGYDPADRIDRELGVDHVSDSFELRRIALTYEQIQQYNPPPNPAKESDSRWEKYVESTGLTDSWELDALDPTTLADLIQSGIDEIRNTVLWSKAVASQQKDRDRLRLVADNWDEVVNYVEEK